MGIFGLFVYLGINISQVTFNLLKMKAQQENNKPSVHYSCHFETKREGEQFTPQHVLSFQMSGTLKLNDGDKEYIFREGEFRFSKRNRLIKFEKTPDVDRPFRCISIPLDQELLRKISIHKKIIPTIGCDKGDAVLKLENHPLLESFFNSMLQYENNLEALNDSLVFIKMKEAIMLLLELVPSLKQTLFDFSEPGKIDLEEFMNRHYHFNVNMSRFAYLSGRSLATFKRDFQKVFQSTPSKWLLSKRLSEAHYLLKEKGRAPTDVYLELGFENLSHFSFAFKKMYGVPPSQIRAAAISA